ncbi:hypothetical protein QAD02_011469 [Eretmocerus hayati]|uniref:Uncharacterized protein n=1 Tax=Eretmocerus hayati TaxID=131215 RepID=A0ACC2NWU5_9HYME|nr:hypothetical protein QAD02_011469 [Eretmocerus hayati]
MEEPQLKKRRIGEDEEKESCETVQSASKCDCNLSNEPADAQSEKQHDISIFHPQKEHESEVSQETKDLECMYARYSEGLIDLEELKNIVMDSKIESHSFEEYKDEPKTCPFKTSHSSSQPNVVSEAPIEEGTSLMVDKQSKNVVSSIDFIPTQKTGSQVKIGLEDDLEPPSEATGQQDIQSVAKLKNYSDKDQDCELDSGIMESGTTSINIFEKMQESDTLICPVFKADARNSKVIDEEDDDHSDSSDKPIDGDEIQIGRIQNSQQAENDSQFTSDNMDDYLRQFDVLDDLEHHSNQDGSDSEGCSNDSEDSDVPEDEIEAMLEEGLPDEFKARRSGRKSDMMYEQKEKLILNEIGHNHFDMLPEGWLQVTHNSGMPLYLHKQSRVCTMAKPYFLGPGSVRKHNVPVSAIPCLQYRRALKEQEEEKEKERARTDLLSSLPNAKIETVQENRASNSVDGEALRSYCQSLFQFKSIKVMRFKSWSQRRRFTKNKKNRKQLERPTLPDGTKLITFPVSNNTNSNDAAQDEHQKNRTPKHWIMNPSGKSYVCILHEYVQHALKKQPTYKFKELENAATPYSAVVCINDMEYGNGFGSSKKQAKACAAKKTLEILIPQMRDKISGESSKDNDSPSSNQVIKSNKVNSETDLSFFDDISITDPRVADFCAKTTEPLPHAILVTCLQRNFGLGDMHIKYSVNTLKHQRNEFTMRVGKHEATVVCRNKKDGKQRAAQAILQLLHPHIQSWGSLLRLYGSRSVKSFKEKKQLEQEITLLQGKAAVNQPNHAILEKLRHEMRKLSEQRQAVKPIGKFITLDLPSGSAANLDNVDL